MVHGIIKAHPMIEGIRDVQEFLRNTREILVWEINTFEQVTFNSINILTLIFPSIGLMRLMRNTKLCLYKSLVTRQELKYSLSSCTRSLVSGSWRHGLENSPL